MHVPWSSGWPAAVHGLTRSGGAWTGRLLDIFNVTAQGVIAGANMVLVDVHPQPDKALCDGPQALLLEELPDFVEDVAIVRRAYEERRRRKGTPPPA